MDLEQTSTDRIQNLGESWNLARIFVEVVGFVVDVADRGFAHKVVVGTIVSVAILKLQLLRKSGLDQNLVWAQYWMSREGMVDWEKLEVAQDTSPDFVADTEVADFGPVGEGNIHHWVRWCQAGLFVL